MRKNYAKFFIREKPVKVLTHLLDGDAYVSSISKKVKMTYSHTAKILNLLEEAGIVELKKDGRVRVAKLTNKGKEIARKLNSVLNLFNKL